MVRRVVADSQADRIAASIRPFERDGKRLGPVGSRIVAEVLLGLLAGDPLSYVNVQPGFERERSTRSRPRLGESPRGRMGAWQRRAWVTRGGTGL